ncbi:Metallo-dependent phosphatase-like protein [Obelidium mucronatum]|nr:Metallo-dependent phosphatase-like protein [Obelidium mucronatum]
MVKSIGFLALLAATATASVLTPTRGALPWNDWNFLTTTDIHGYINGRGISMQGQYSANMADFAVFVDSMKVKAAAMNVELFVVDCGDQHDGTALSDNLIGQKVDGDLTTPAINLVDYDILAIGNHELYVNPIIDQVSGTIAPYWGPKFLTGNVYTSTDGKFNAATSKPIGQRFRKFTGSKGSKVTAFGFLFQGFAGQQGNHSTITTVTSEVNQTWFTDAIKEKPDFFLLAGHISLRYVDKAGKSSPQTEWAAAIKAIRAVHATVPIVVFGGHYHIRDFMIMGDNVYGISAGRYMETIGFMSLKKDGSGVDRRYLDANVPTYNYHLGQAEATPLGSSTEKGKKILDIIATASVKTESTKIIGTAPKDYYMNRVNNTHENSIYRLVGEYMAPTWQKPAPANPAYFIINSGSIRLDIFSGPFTYDSAFQASPFEDYTYVVPDVPFSVISTFKATYENWRVNQTFHRRDAICNGTVGYVTKDDLSATNPGDDTFHCPLTFISNPDYAVYSPRTLPCNTPADQKWDLVFYDYIEKDIKTVLKGAYNISTLPVGASPAYVKGQVASALFPEMATKFWQPKSVQPVIAPEVCNGAVTATTAATGTAVSGIPTATVVPVKNLYSAASATTTMFSATLFAALIYVF